MWPVCSRALAQFHGLSNRHLSHVAVMQNTTYLMLVTCFVLHENAVNMHAVLLAY